MKKLILFLLFPALSFGQKQEKPQTIYSSEAFQYFYVNQNNKSMSNIEEIWKDVIGYEGYYQVSSIGRVRSLDRQLKNNHTTYDLKGVILKNRITDRGYHTVQLSRKCRSKQKFVHRIIAESFFTKPINATETNHKNGIRSDNRLENLEWVTHAENMQHSIKVLGRRPPTSGSSHYLSKRVGQFDLEDKLIEIFESCGDAGRKTKSSYSSIARCARKERGTHLGFKWRYV